MGVLNQTSEAMAAQSARARELGIVISDEAAAASLALTQRMSELRRVGQGFVQQATQALTPALNTVAQAFLNMGSAANFGSEAGRVLANVLLTVIETGARVAQIFNSIGEGIGAFAAGVASNFRGGQGIIATMEEFFNRAEERGRGFQRFVDDLQALPETPSLVFDAPQFEKSLTAGARFTEQLVQATAARKELAEVQRQAIPIAEDDRKALEPDPQLLELLEIQRRQAREVIQEIRREQREIERQQERAQRFLFNTLERGLDGFLRGARTVREAFADMISDITRQLARLAAQEAFGPLFGAQQGAGAGPFSNFLAGIGGLLPGFQRGTSFTVGGSGGPDSQAVAFRATPGERVTVTPSGADPMAGVTIIQNLHFQGQPDPLAAQQVATAAAIGLRQAAARNA